jgi:radical SAM protein with 4Fe4S-binding SPASM domain
MDRSGASEAMAGMGGLSPPRSLTLAVTGGCNLACAHCLVEAGPAIGGHVPAPTVRRIVSEFAALGGEAICLTGGEPLLHPQWRELLASCREQPSFRSLSLQTNGTLIGDAQVRALQSLRFDGLAIQVSLDGSSPATHDRVRGPGAFRRTLAGLRRLAAAGLGSHVSIAFTEMRHNVHDLPALLELVEVLGLRSLTSGTLVSRGRAAAADDLAPPTPEQYRALLARYRDDPRFRALYDVRGNFAALEWWKHRRERGPECCVLVEHPFVTAEGTIYPGALLRADDFAVNGAFEKPLATALLEGVAPWRLLLEASRLRRSRLPECRGCDGEVHCGGGCMGRAHAASGELFALEDRCELRRAVYGWRDEEEPRVRPASIVVNHPRT